MFSILTPSSCVWVIHGCLRVQKASKLWQAGNDHSLKVVGIPMENVHPGHRTNIDSGKVCAGKQPKWLQSQGTFRVRYLTCLEHCGFWALKSPWMWTCSPEEWSTWVTPSAVLFFESEMTENYTAEQWPFTRFGVHELQELTYIGIHILCIYHSCWNLNLNSSSLNFKMGYLASYRHSFRALKELTPSFPRICS